MLSYLINRVKTLKEVDKKQSFFIAKELSIITVNLLWYPEKLNDHTARLRSLAQHVLITFPNNDNAKALVILIKQKALALEAKI